MITAHYQLSCNQRDCSTAYLPTPVEFICRRLIEEGALNAGWTKRGRRHYCPEHSTKPAGGAA